jgi:hypothetical protein
MKHVALRGRQIPKELTWYDWIMLRICAMNNKDHQARKEELEGFYYINKSSIQTIVQLTKQFKARNLVS